jgi:hypothetical protein
LFDLHAPLKQFNKKKNHKPYITYNLRLMIREKNKAYKKYLQKRTNESRKYYVELRNYVNAAINRKKRVYMKYILETCKGDTKKLWKNLSDWGINTKNKIKNQLPDSLCKPEELNNYFLSVAGSCIINQDTANFYSNNPLSSSAMFSFKEITNDDLLKSLRTIKTNASGADNISIAMLNLVMPYCIDTIRNLFNESIRIGEFPKIWKTANVIPIPKVTSPTSFSDLRPISILPALSKLFEKLLAVQIVNFLDQNNILPDIQSGFRGNYSTRTALLRVTDDLAHAMDKSKPSILILLDQSKAFDLVHFDLLLIKLKHIGFQEGALRFMKSYLNGRRQKIFLDDRMQSLLKATTSGVPQGSVLGPILFSIYTYDLPKYLQYCKLHMYADDIQLQYSFHIDHAYDAINNLNSDLANIAAYTTDHGLRLNSGKTLALTVGSERQRITIESNFTIKLNNENVKWVQSVKSLGLVINGSLSFEEHINNIYRKCMQKLRSVYGLKFQLDQQTKLQLVKTIIYPHSDYCSLVYYYFLTNENCLKLQKIQNACIRFVRCVPRRHHITSHLVRLNEVNFRLRTLFQAAVFLHKLLLTKVPSYLHQLLLRRSEEHCRNIRFDTFTIPQHSSKKFEGSFSYMAPTILNKFLEYLNLPEGHLRTKIEKLCVGYLIES